jgi:acyl-CoA synthetase (AMP-forming)/AMP-acid ligase II
MNVAEILREQARARPGAAAIIDTWRGHCRSTSFAELDRAAAAAAGLLRQQGLQAGDAVLVFQRMSLELYVALLAIFRLGLLAMFVDPSAGRSHIEQCCALCRPKALIAGPRAHLLRLVSPAVRRIPVKFVIGPALPGAIPWTRAGRVLPHQEVLACRPETPALLTFTSGSTGEAKAVVRSHGFLLAQHRVLTRSLELPAGDVDLTTLPVVVLANLASGATSLIPDLDLRCLGALDPAPVVAQVRAHRPTSASGSPAFFERLARYCAGQGLALGNFRKLLVGGAPVFPRLLDQMQTLAPGADVVAVYGSTEAEPIAHVAGHEVTPEDVAAMRSGRGLLAGAPVEAIRLRILAERNGLPSGPLTEAEFAARCLPAGRPGEIVVSGEHVLPGYLHGRGDEQTKLRVDGVTWHRTGDAGYLDGRGRLWLLGRCLARVEDGRGVLYPLAVEAAAHQVPAVRRAALAAQGGRRVLAVELEDRRAGANLDRLRADLSWAQLDEVRVCRAIPVDRRHHAKVDYPLLWRLLEKTRGRGPKG